MAIESFKRYEIKFEVENQKLPFVIRRIKEYMVPDKYNADGKPYIISNIYFDTADDMLIRESLEKPFYKEKLRLRSYGVCKPSDMVFLEIKRKAFGIVNKRRTPMTLSAAYDFIANGGDIKETPDMNRQVLHEIEYMYSTVNPVPKVYLAYDRFAFFSQTDKSLRVTFDTNIRARRTDLALDTTDEGKLLRNDGVWVMEVKSSGAIPLWLTKILSEYALYRTSYSKYGEEYKRYVKEEEKKKCTIYYSEPQLLPSLHLAAH